MTAISITSQPSNKTLDPAKTTIYGNISGNPATFSVTATEDLSTGTLSYQWQRALPLDPTNFSDIVGATSSSYTINSEGNGNINGAIYRCKINGSNIVDPTYSNSAILTIRTFEFSYEQTSSFNMVGILTAGSNSSSYDEFGYSVSISGDGKTIAIGAPNDEPEGFTDTGTVHIFQRSGNNFNRIGILTSGPNASSGDKFGSAIAMSYDGNKIYIDALEDEITGSNTGVVYAFDRVGNSFTQVGFLTGTNPVDVYDIFGNHYTTGNPDNNYYGYSLATNSNGNTLIVGAPYGGVDTYYGPDVSGLAYVYDRTGNTFNRVGVLTGSYSKEWGDSFGWSVAASSDGNTIIVGAKWDETPLTSADRGVSYVFERLGNTFTQVGILTGSKTSLTSGTPGTDYDYFGWSVAVSSDGKIIAIGTPDDEDTGSTSSSGRVYVYERVGSSFNEVGILTAGENLNQNDNFGYSVAMSSNGKIIVVGAPYDDVPLYQWGTVYVFERSGNNFNQVGILTGPFAIDGSVSNGGNSANFGYSVGISNSGDTIVVGAKNKYNNNINPSGSAYVFDRQTNNSFNEGSSINFSIVTTNVPDGTTLYYTIPNTSPSNFVDNTNNGSFVVNGGVGSFSKTLKSDSLTEGTQTFTTFIRTDSTSGSPVAVSSFTINDTSLSPPAVIITSNPTNQILDPQKNKSEGSLPGNPATFSVTATEDLSTGTLSYQWQRSADEGTTWNNITGATSSSYIINSVGNGNVDGAIYRCRVSGTTGILDSYSNTATLTVRTFSLTVSPPLQSNEGTTLSFNVFTTNVTNGTILYYTINNASPLDFEDNSISGSFVVNNNIGSFTKVLKNDLETEGNEKFSIFIKTGSTNGNSVESSSYTIIDTSIAPVYTGAVVHITGVNIMSGLTIF